MEKTNPEASPAQLFVIPTPIGNLKDITLRALEVLKEVDEILCEDTRVTQKLLSHYQITKKVSSFHNFNEHKRLSSIVENLKSGKRVALVSDAGTPGISDPGYLLIRSCVEEGISFECLPGATAFVPALLKSGFPSDRFFFEGFLPPKKGRNKRLDFLATLSTTIVLYESPHRLAKTLQQLLETFGPDRCIAVIRELTKIHEEVIRGTLKELQVHFGDRKVKGEIVLVIDGPGKKKKNTNPQVEE